MLYITLGQSNLRVSKIAFGGGPMGGFDFGEVNFEDLARSVPQALDLGVNFFDVADIYGLGAAEEFLGRALGSSRSRAVIATKFGVRRSPEGKTYYDNSPEWLRQAIESSLRRLQTSYIDLYQVHYRDPAVPWHILVETLDDLREEGKFRFAGLSNILLADIPKEILPSWIVSIQGEFSFVRREWEGEFQTVSESIGLTPLFYGCLGQGILGARYNRDSKFSDNDRRNKPQYVNFHGAEFERSLCLVEKVKSLAKQKSCTAAQIAIRWILERAPCGVAIVGIKSCKQLDDIAHSVDIAWSKSDFESLEK